MHHLDATEYADAHLQLSREEAEWPQRVPRAGNKAQAEFLSQPSEQSPERDGRTKRWATVREGLTRLN